MLDGHIEFAKTLEPKQLSFEVGDFHYAPTYSMPLAGHVAAMAPAQLSLRIEISQRSGVLRCSGYSEAMVVSIFFFVILVSSPILPLYNSSSHFSIIHI